MTDKLNKKVNKYVCYLGTVHYTIESDAEDFFDPTKKGQMYHREDGPAEIYPIENGLNGECYYYLFGKKMTKEEHTRQVREMKLKQLLD